MSVPHLNYVNIPLSQCWHYNKTMPTSVTAIWLWWLMCIYNVSNTVQALHNMTSAGPTKMNNLVTVIIPILQLVTMRPESLDTTRKAMQPESHLPRQPSSKTQSPICLSSSFNSLWFLGGQGYYFFLYIPVTQLCAWHMLGAQWMFVEWILLSEFKSGQ